MKGDDFGKESPDALDPFSEDETPAALAPEGDSEDRPVEEPREEERRPEPTPAPRPHRRSSSEGAERRSAPVEDDASGDDEPESEFTHEGEPEYEQDDPLAPGFDIEKGTPLSGQRGDHDLPARAKIKNAKEFFNAEVLYRFDILEDEARKEIAGSYRIELKGFQGGVWTLTLGESLDIVNRREEAEIVLTLQQRDFLQLVNGQLNPQLAMFAQKMRVQGDLRKAVSFQAILVPSVD